jgi:hypothetical protein
MDRGYVAGYDPGGDGSHGVAIIRVEDGLPVLAQMDTLRTTEQAIELFAALPSLEAIGIDTLTCWSTGPSGWRPADRWLRQTYSAVSNSIASPNSLFGSMGLNGMAVLLALRQHHPGLFVTETHPKVLYWHLASKKYAYQAMKQEMDALLGEMLSIEKAIATEHEWDAGLSAVAALRAVRGAWRRNLHAMPTVTGERLIWPAGVTEYSWPG